MKNVLGFKLGKEYIPIWEVFIILFIIFMASICLFLGYGIFTTASNGVEIKTSTINYDEKSIIKDLSNIPDEILTKSYNEGTLEDLYNKNYKKYINSTDTSLNFININYSLYGNIDSTIYRININKNHLFLFNEINKSLSENNSIYVVDSDMGFHRLYLDKANVVNDYSIDDGYTRIDVDNWVFYYNEESDAFYGYFYIDQDEFYEHYIVVNGDGYDLSIDAYKEFFKNISKNISVDVSSSYSYTGLNLSKDYKKYKLDDSIALDLYTNVLINNISNVIKKGDNSLNISLKNEPGENISITEVNNSIEDSTSNTNKNGYLQYTFGNKAIYLKYNLNDYPEFNYSLGAFNGILFSVNDKTMIIQFNKNYEFSSQEELDNILNDTLGQFIIC